MSYLLLDDKLPKHRKISGLPIQAKWLHVCALSHCAEELTDGLVTRHALAMVAAVSEVNPAKFVPLLVERGLWEPVRDGWLMHHYLEHNPSRAEVLAKRAKRSEAGRRGGLASGKSRSKDEANAEANASSIVRQPLNPIPSPSHESVSSSLAVTRYDANGGDDFADANDYNHALHMLIDACGNTPEAREKLTDDAAKYGAPEARLVAIRWAVTQPGTTSPLGKARSMLKNGSAAA